MRPNAVDLCGLTSVWWLKMHTIHLRERSSDEYCIASVASTARVGVASRCHLVGNPISSVFVKLSRFAVQNPNAWASLSIQVLHLSRHSDQVAELLDQQFTPSHVIVREFDSCRRQLFFFFLTDFVMLCHTGVSNCR